MIDLKLTEEEKEMILLNRKIGKEAEKRGELNNNFVGIFLMVEGVPSSSDAIDNMAAMSVLFFRKNPELKEKFLDLAFKITSKTDE